MNGARAISPGSTIGVLGGGPRARMLMQAAARLGYRVHVYAPRADSPAGQIAHQEVTAAYDDAAALAAFARECAAVTCESDRVPAASLREIESLTQLHPHWSVWETCQDRARMKNWLKQGGFPQARFAEVAAGGDIAAGIREVGRPCVVKTAGAEDEDPVQVRDEAEVAGAERSVARRACVIEQWIDLACEVSVVMARTARAAIRVFPLVENLRTDHRLDFSNYWHFPIAAGTKRSGKGRIGSIWHHTCRWIINVRFFERRQFQVDAIGNEWTHPHWNMEV